MSDQNKVNTAKELDVKHKNMLGLIDHLIELYSTAYNMCIAGDYDKCMDFIDIHGMKFGICNVIGTKNLSDNISDTEVNEFIQWFMKSRTLRHYYCHVPCDYIYKSLQWAIGLLPANIEPKTKAIYNEHIKETFKLRLDRLIEAREHYKTKLSFVL